MTSLARVRLALRALAPMSQPLAGKAFRLAEGLTTEQLKGASHLIYDGEASGDGAAPWIVVGLQVPDPILAMVGTHGGTATLVVTVCGATHDQALLIAEACDRAWSGARIEVPGWSIGALVPKTPTGPYAAGLTALDTNLRYQTIRLPYDLTLSRAA